MHRKREAKNGNNGVDIDVDVNVRVTQVLADDAAITDALASPTERAIYALLLGAAEPERWARVVRAHEERVAGSAAAESSRVRRLVGMGGRAARWMLGVPGEAGLKTFSRRDGIGVEEGAQVDEGALAACVEAMEVEVEEGGSGEREVQVERVGLGSEGAVSWVSMWPRRNLEGDMVVHRVRR
jgi:hypothetical protein